MVDSTNVDIAFLRETSEKLLLPDTLSHIQREAFVELVHQDLSGKLNSLSTNSIDEGSSNMDNKLISDDEVIHEPDWALLVATKVEFETCLEYFESV